MRLEGNTRINTPSASALQILDIGAEFLLGIKTNLSRNGAINRALFDSLINNGRRLFRKERAI
jgi:hypothetical protein